jgi:lipopolysaccharide transport system ATP-binding protein
MIRSHEDVALHVEGLGKMYRLGAKKRGRDSLADAYTQRLREWTGRSKREPKRTFWALQNATFDVRRGENVGIIGMNGAGKSTLLKVLSRIVTPTTGRAEIRGRVGALLEVGTGFHAELSGRENVYLYGAILGMSVKEIAAKFDAIVEFAGVWEFIDTPVKRYSSGMYVRLAFAVAAHLDPEVLILDEVLAVGDLTFQRKCIEFSKGLQKKNATILFVSHNMFSIKSMCERVIYLRKGELVYDGPTDQGIALYEDDARLAATGGADETPEKWPIRFTDVRLLNDEGDAKTVFEFGESMKLRMTYTTREPLKNPNVVVALVRSDNVGCCNYSTETDGVELGTLDGEGEIELDIPPLKLVSEAYTISILVREPGFGKALCQQVGGSFHVRHDLYDMHFGVFHEPGKWSLRAAGNNGSALLAPTEAHAAPAEDPRTAR